MQNDAFEPANTLNHPDQRPTEATNQTNRPLYPSTDHMVHSAGFEPTTF